MKKSTYLAILSLVSFFSLAEPRYYELRVDGLACPYCAYGIEKKLKSLQGMDRNTINIKLNEGLVIFVADTEAAITEPELKGLIDDAGFTLKQYKVQAYYEK